MKRENELEAALIEARSAVRDALRRIDGKSGSARKRIELDANEVARALDANPALVKQAIARPNVLWALSDRAIADTALELARKKLAGARVEGIVFDRRGPRIYAEVA